MGITFPFAEDETGSKRLSNWTKTTPEFLQSRARVCFQKPHGQVSQTESSTQRTHPKHSPARGCVDSGKNPFIQLSRPGEDVTFFPEPSVATQGALSGPRTQALAGCIERAGSPAGLRAALRVFIHSQAV